MVTFDVHYVTVESMADIEIVVEFTRQLMVLRETSFILGDLDVFMISFSVIAEGQTGKE